MRDVVIVSAVRTPIGKFGGSLRDLSPGILGATVVRESVKRANLPPQEVDQVVLGNVIHTEARDMYLSRYAAITGGLPEGTSALTVNRLCGSGLQAIICGAHAICAGDAQITVAGGAESMSRAPYWIDGLRWGQRMNNTIATDVLTGALTDPFEQMHMGITAENVARKWKISRDDQDELAVESHRRALSAIAASRFKDEIIGIELTTKSGRVTFDTDEGPRVDANLENLAKLKPVFDIGGTVTAGNSSTINDGAAAIVMMERCAADARGLKPMARLIDYSTVGVDPRYMGIGPVPAVRKLLRKVGQNLDNVDVIELNEAFAAQALAVVRELGLSSARTNPNGGAISLGHPIGATGAILTVKALHELRRRGGKFAVIAMCIGGGQGIAAIFENLN